jgi:hypothetical protein
MQTISAQAIANQTLQAQLGNQAVTLNIYQFTYGLFMDVLVAGSLIASCIPCQNLNRIVRYAYLGFQGDFIWYDSQGTEDPLYYGIGSRWQLLYLSAADLSAAGQAG